MEITQRLVDNVRRLVGIDGVALVIHFPEQRRVLHHRFVDQRGNGTHATKRSRERCLDGSAHLGIERRQDPRDHGLSVIDDTLLQDALRILVEDHAARRPERLLALERLLLTNLLGLVRSKHRLTGERLAHQLELSRIGQLTSIRVPILLDVPRLRRVLRVSLGDLTNPRLTKRRDEVENTSLTCGDLPATHIATHRTQFPRLLQRLL